MSKNTLDKKRKKSTELPEVSKEFLRGNEKLCKDILKNKKKKGGPYSKTKRESRRNEVYRLHFDYGYSATKISELMKINRNTINSDIQYWYNNVIRNWKRSNVEFSVIKHIERLELHKTRLREYLDQTKSLSEKLVIEKAILDVETKIGQTNLKLCESSEKVHKLSTKWLNEWINSEMYECGIISIKEKILSEYIIKYGQIESIQRFGETFRLVYLLKTDEDMIREIERVPSIPDIQEYIREDEESTMKWD